MKALATYCLIAGFFSAVALAGDGHLESFDLDFPFAFG
jgi:hypothetical protein